MYIVLTNLFSFKSDRGIKSCDQSKVVDPYIITDETGGQLFLHRYYSPAVQNLLYESLTIIVRQHSEIASQTCIWGQLKASDREILDISKYSDLVKSDKEIRAFIACKVGNIRLIDNIDI